MTAAGSSSPRLATRLVFLVAGFGVSCWAPIVPFVKQNLGIDEGILGLLLLCIGIGSIASMLVTGFLATRYGSKPVIITSGCGLLAILPFLPAATTAPTLGIALFLFGASLGSLDVAMNIHAVEVERAAGRPLMSGFHGLFSVGGFAGAGTVTLLLMLGIDLLASCLLCSFLMLLAMVVAWPKLLITSRSSGGPLLAIPKGIVLLLAILAAVTFLVEGAILDWGALLITDAGHVSASRGGLAYMIFSIAMVTGRFTGDVATARYGDRKILIWGGLLCLSGFVVLLTVPVSWTALGGFFLIGLGASNMVPVLFRRAGAQKIMPPALAVAAVTTMGYAGVLAGPAGIGLVADAFDLPTAFWMLAALMCLVPLFAARVTR